MSKQKQRRESAVEPGSAEAKAPTTVAVHPPRKKRLPWALIVTCVALLATGAILWASRDVRARSAALRAMNECGATALRDSDGLSDGYGIVQCSQHRGEIERYLSACEVNPPLALEVFREAMDKGTSSAKLVAMYSAFYLTLHGCLEAEDFQRILDHVGPAEKDADLRRTAQRAISDLTVIDDPGHGARYEGVPPDLPPVVKDPKDDRDPLPHKVQTKESTLKGTDKAVVLVRWSDPEVARKWWDMTAQSGRWDKDLQRFVLPSKPAETAKGSGN